MQRRLPRHTSSCRARRRNVQRLSRTAARETKPPGVASAHMTCAPVRLGAAAAGSDRTGYIIPDAGKDLPDIRKEPAGQKTRAQGRIGMAARILIRNATIISVDPGIGDLGRGDILVEGSKIAAIAPAIAADDAEVIDAGTMIAIPGFVDSHRHTWESLLRATGPDWSLAQYFTAVRVVMGGLYTPEDNYIANLLGALDALDGGITTLYDWSHNNNSPEHADAAVQGLKDSGIRGVFGYGNANAEWFPPSTIPTDTDDIRRVRKQHFPSDDGLVTMAVAARGPQFTTLDITERDFRIARELGVRITVHVGDGLWGLRRPVAQLDSRGLLGNDVTYVHCNTIADDEFRLIGDSGGTGSMSPEVEMQMGHGLPTALRFLAAGIRPSISIDVVTTVPSDMFSAMRALLASTRLMAHGAALEQRKTLHPLPLTSRDVLEFATLQGA